MLFVKIIHLEENPALFFTAKIYKVDAKKHKVFLVNLWKFFESVAEILITKFRKKDGVKFTKLSSVQSMAKYYRKDSQNYQSFFNSCVCLVILWICL